MHMRTRTQAYLPSVLVLLITACVHLLIARPLDAQSVSATQPASSLRISETSIPDHTYDRWYELWLGGSQAGSVHNVGFVDDLGRLHTLSQTQMTLNRAGTNMTIDITSEFLESADGTPISMRVTQAMGTHPTTKLYLFKPDGVLVVDNPSESDLRSGHSDAPLDESKADKHPLPEGVWLAPAAADRYLAQRLASGAETITMRTLDPSTGLTPVSTTRTHFAHTTTIVLGREVEAISCHNTINNNGTLVESREYIDPTGVLLRSTMQLGAIEMQLIASDQLHATAVVDPTELMLSTFVEPDQSIARPRTSTKASYLLSLPDGSLPTLPTSAYQSVERLDPSHARVEIDMQSPKPIADDTLTDLDRYLKSTDFADTTDPMIIKLTREALEQLDKNATDLQRALALRTLVYRHITNKDYGVAFATASQTARSQQGDCTEHGVLLAALLREAHIPSRVAVGLVYIPTGQYKHGAFGYHMWTQALLPLKDNQHAWIDLDATLDERLAFDATHIALGISDLADDGASTPSSMIAIVPLLGRLQIAVESVQ